MLPLPSPANLKALYVPVKTIPVCNALLPSVLASVRPMPSMPFIAGGSTFSVALMPFIAPDMVLTPPPSRDPKFLSTPVSMLCMLAPSSLLALSNCVRLFVSELALLAASLLTSARFKVDVPTLFTAGKNVSRNATCPVAATLALAWVALKLASLNNSKAC